MKVARRSEKSPYCDAHGTVKWIGKDRRPGSHTSMASDKGAEPFGGALANLLAKLERVPIGDQARRRRPPKIRNHG